MIRFLLFVFLIIITISIACLLFIAWASNPYEKRESNFISGQSSNTDTTGTFSIMSFNAGYFKGAINSSRTVSKHAMNANLLSFKALIQKVQPDIIAMQEVDIKSQRTFYVDQLNWLKDELNFSYAAYALAWNKRYVPFPGVTSSSQFGAMASGQALISKHPIIQNKKLVLTEADSLKDVHSFFVIQNLAKTLYTQRIAQISTIQIGNGEIIVINLHLENSNASSRIKQIKDVIHEYRTNWLMKPVIILGDLNTIMPNELKSKLLSAEEKSWFTKDSTIEQLIQVPLRSLSLISTDVTWPATHPRIKFDHIFFNDLIEPVDETVIYSQTASDHSPVLFRFRIRKNNY